MLIHKFLGRVQSLIACASGSSSSGYCSSSSSSSSSIITSSNSNGKSSNSGSDGIRSSLHIFNSIRTNYNNKNKLST